MLNGDDRHFTVDRTAQFAHQKKDTNQMRTDKNKPTKKKQVRKPAALELALTPAERRQILKERAMKRIRGRDAIRPIEDATIQSTVSEEGNRRVLRDRNGKVVAVAYYNKASEVEFPRELLNRSAVDDMVNDPPHYTAHPSGVECIQITEHMGFCLGNAFKYIWRADLKGNSIEDLRKARWYLDREIALREKQAQHIIHETPVH